MAVGAMPPSASWAGSPAIRGSTESVRMALLTVSQIGLQFAWGIEMTYCTPYLLQLGLTKSKTSLVWIAGPLSGLVMQPVIGVLADNSRSRWGRRRPFMLAGAVLVASLLLILGWTSEIVGYFITDPDIAKSYVVPLAVVTIYVTDFSINITQSTSRSLIIDTLPIPKQQLGSAWATRMVALGSMMTYGVGTIDLVGIFGSVFGATQFKQLTFIAATMFLATTLITCWAVEERVLITRKDVDVSSNLTKLLTRIMKTTFNLPERIQAICWPVFWSWIGWFPFMFYSTTWVGEVYFRYHPESKTSGDPVGDIGRVGSHSMVIFSVINLLSSIGLPWVIEAPDSTSDKRSFTPRPPPRLSPFISPVVAILQGKKPTLLTSWQWSHLVFAGAMCLAPFVTSVRMATIIVSLCGVSSTLNNWAPTALIGVEINRLNAPSTHLNGNSYRPLRATENFASPGASPKLLHLNHLDRDIIDDEKEPLSLDERDDTATTGETAGIYLGILNIFCTIPQFIGTFISWVVFSILEPGKTLELSKEGSHEAVKETSDRPNGISVCLFIGALSVAGAAYATGRMRKKGMR